MLNFNDLTTGDLKITNVGTKDFKIVFHDGKGITSKSGDFATATGFAKVQLGSGTVVIRFPKAIALRFGLTRHFIQRRRKLRKFDASKDYKDRDLVKPVLTDTSHYGKAG